MSTATVPTVTIPPPAPTVPAALPSPVDALASPAKPKTEPPLAPPPQELLAMEHEQGPAPATESPLAVSPSPERVEVPLPQANVSILKIPWCGWC